MSRPALTVVFVVHREQAFVEPCVRSVLGQGFAGVELVVVDDASPDHGPEVLDELAERDERLRVLHLPERVGAGEARNLALAQAEGDFVWFLDVRDRLADGALATVAEALADADPDVLLVHHTVTTRLGDERPGPHRKRLAGLARQAPGPLAERPAAAATAPDTHDKVFRRAHLERIGARFGSGAHAGMTVTWPALLAAERIAAVPEPLVVRGGRRGPGPVAGLLDAYDAVFAFADEQAPAARPLILPQLRRHVLALAGALRRAERRAFFADASAAFRRHRRGDEPLPGGRAATLRTRVLERGDARAFTLLEASAARGRALRRRRAAVARRRAKLAARLRAHRLQRHYARARRRPLDPDLAVFAAYWYRGYACNPRAIHEKARELVPGLRGVWVVNREGAAGMPDGVEHVIAGTREYYDVLARATYFVNNVNFPNHLVKRPGTVHVMTHHGTPLKRMGLDLRDTQVAGRRMDFEALLRRCARWDFSVSSNRLSTLVWERVYPTDYETLEVGYPRNDVLATATPSDVARIRAELDLAPDQTAVLYAPTHREYRDGYVPTLDLAAVAEGLGPDHVLLARLHYFYGADPVLRRLHREGRVRDVGAHPSVEELCLAADALVTDYSSLMFDYAVLDRPIVIHAPDWEVYRAMRGTYFDLLAEPPGLVTRTDAGVVDALRSGAAAGEEATAARAAFRARYCALDDGGAAERVVRRVFLGEPAAAGRPEPAVAR